MKNLLGDLRAFHLACDVPVLDGAQFPSTDRVELRERLLREEFTEFCEAVAARDLVETADAIADIIYVAVGTALEFGIPLDRVWDEVQRSNMAKVDQATGKVRRRPDGKILKPDGWQPPDVRTAIALPHEKRTWCYAQPPSVYEIAPCSCGNTDTQWSEFKGHLWCARCEKDFVPEHGGIFDGPIPVTVCACLGISFDRINLETGAIERFEDYMEGEK